MDALSRHRHSLARAKALARSLGMDVDDAYIALWDALGVVRERGFAYTAAKRAMTRSAKRSPLRAMAEGEDFADAAPNPEDLSRVAELKARIVRMGWTRIERVVLAMLFKGATAKEVAKRLKIHEVTAAKRLAHMRKRIAKELGS